MMLYFSSIYINFTTEQMCLGCSSFGEVTIPTLFLIRIDLVAPFGGVISCSYQTSTLRLISFLDRQMGVLGFI
jgi:hypothetical protein